MLSHTVFSSIASVEFTSTDLLNRLKITPMPELSFCLNGVLNLKRHSPQLTLVLEVQMLILYPNNLENRRESNKQGFQCPFCSLKRKLLILN